MEKQTVFFSHSSKDKDALIAFKSRFCEITCDVVNVFMSSDGESIPFGSNWVHKIDEGLKAAKIMFIFVTPNSILSSWIYFEAGYAYSRDIKVIPVGLGVDVTLLKPPLNLLQGFNLNSAESLNNFIAVVNKEFSLKFLESFSEKDYTTISTHIDGDNCVDVDDVFKEISFSIYPTYTDSEIEYDLNTLYDGFVNYLKERHMVYSQNEQKKILVAGIQIVLTPKILNTSKHIDVYISPYNLDLSLNIIKEWLIKCLKQGSYYLWLYPKNDINLLLNEASISSIVYRNLDKFEVIQNKANSYKYKSYTFSLTKSDSDIPRLVIAYPVNDLCANNIRELIKMLLVTKLIQIV